jgi:chromosome segregation ATPase
LNLKCDFLVSILRFFKFNLCCYSAETSAAEERASSAEAAATSAREELEFARASLQPMSEAAEAARAEVAEAREETEALSGEVGLCTSRIQLTHSLKAPGFINP